MGDFPILSCWNTCYPYYCKVTHFFSIQFLRRWSCHTPIKFAETFQWLQMIYFAYLFVDSNLYKINGNYICIILSHGIQKTHSDLEKRYLRSFGQEFGWTCKDKSFQVHSYVIPILGVFYFSIYLFCCCHCNVHSSIIKTSLTMYILITNFFYI